jgi:hypothetical protein
MGEFCCGARNLQKVPLWELLAGNSQFPIFQVCARCTAGLSRTRERMGGKRCLEALADAISKRE